MSKKLGFFVLVAAMAFMMSTMVASAAAPGSKTNVNGTGTGTLSKAISGHSVHGNYKNNTNSCASCHQTHTATSTANLLFKSDAYEACVACHDGTLGIYNVMDQVSEGSGTFEMTATYNGSMHDVDGSKELNAAYGARTEIAATAGNKSTYSNWDKEFSCESCHNPHGSYSDRLLSNNTLAESTLANGETTVKIPGITRQYVAQKDKADGTSTGGKFTAFGNQWDGINIVGSFGTPTDTTAVITTLNALDNSAIRTALGTTVSQTPDGGMLNTPNREVAAAYIKLTAADVAGYYKEAGVAENDVIVQVYKYMYDFTSNSIKWVPTPVMSTSNKKLSITAGDETTQVVQGTNVLVANPVKGFYKIDGTSAIKDVTTLNNVTLPLIVKLALVPSTTNTAVVNGEKEFVSDELTNYGGGKNKEVTAYSEWCGTCHTDYFSANKVGTGLNADMNHHTVNSESNGRNCGYCHFAHGTDVNLMKDALGRTVTTLTGTNMTDAEKAAYDTVTVDGKWDAAEARDYLKDVNPSSALKRFTNMTVCYGCHSASHYGAMGNNGTTGVGSSAGLGNGQTSAGTW